MPTAKAAAPKKAARPAVAAKAAQRKPARPAGAERKAYVVLRAFTLSSTGEAHLIGEDFDGTDAQAARLMGLGYIKEA